jgi:aspartyl-tRNA(Asn)/glutamyl-tRNA(Gln) amidotransferase subunit B
VSVRRRGAAGFGTKTEVKNMNSFRNVERALEFEISRQIRLIEDGGRVVQETLLWDAAMNAAYPMRSKEEAHDYRYFPDPDLVPVLVDEPWVAAVRSSLVELPGVRRDRYVSELGLPRYDADVLTSEKEIADYFEEALAALPPETGAAVQENAKAVSNWVMTEVLRVQGEKKAALKDLPATPAGLAALIGLIRGGTISGKIAKDVFAVMVESGEEPGAIVSARGLTQVSDAAAIERVVEEVLDASPGQVAKYAGGNEKLFGFFVGETMKRMGGKANPAVVNQILRRKLAERKG